MSKYKVEIFAYLDEIFEGEDIDDVEASVRHDPRGWVETTEINPN